MLGVELVKVLEESQIEKTDAQIILDKFQGFITKASEWESVAKSIVVKDVSQTDDMAKAREARLALKDIRVEADKTRKALKERSLREGRAIDGIGNVIKALIVPLEEYLEKQEKFAENIEKERLAKLLDSRIAELSKYVEDVSMYNVSDMSDEAFSNLISMLKEAYDRKQDAIKKAEEDKKEQDRIAEEKRLEMEKENDRLKAEAKEKDDKLEEERKEKAKLADELKKKEEAEAKEKADKEEKERQEKLAPEKDKLLKYAEDILLVKKPSDISDVALQIILTAEKKILAISQEIKSKVNSL